MSISGMDSVLLEIECKTGNVSLSERNKEREPEGFYLSTTLLEIENLASADYQSVSLTISTDEDTMRDAVSFQISGHHMKHDASGRVFHATLDLHLPHREAARVRDFLNFLLIEHKI